jgi:hypothetical protein
LIFPKLLLDIEGVAATLHLATHEPAQAYTADPDCAFSTNTVETFIFA